MLGFPGPFLVPTILFGFSIKTETEPSVLVQLIKSSDSRELERIEWKEKKKKEERTI